MNLYQNQIANNGFTVIEDVFSEEQILRFCEKIESVTCSNDNLKQIYRPEAIDWEKETEFTCSVPRGGMMIMKPLLLHSSNRTTNNNKRRVIHIEFCSQELPDELQWSERMIQPNI